MDVSLKKEGRSKGGVACVKCTFRDCGRSFPEVQSAAEHIVSKHIGAVKWRCTFPGCNKEYNHSYDLKRHHQTKHGVKLPQRGRRRHDIPMISASDVEFSASSSPFDYTMSSPSIFSNSPARHAISITPKSDSLSLKSPQTKTSAENQLTGLPLAAEFPPSFWDFLQPDNLNSAQGPQTTPSLGRQVDSLDSFSTTFSGVPNHLTGRALYPPTQLHFPKCRCAHDALHAAGHIFPDYSPMLASMMLSNGYDPTGGEIQSALPSPRMQPSQTNVLFGGTDPTLSGPNSTYLQPYLGNLPPFIDMTIQRPKQSNDSSESSTLTATAQHPDASWSLQPSLLTWYRSVGERQNLDACSFEGFPSDGLDLSGSQGTSDLSWLSPRTSQENEGMSLEDILNDHAPAPFTRGRM
ncbi:hypothetical protein FRC17_004626 [Serendipita sp. 399]|nr:hypothetical protein FRC17_004626 [Serendipita sp. 399]